MVTNSKTLIGALIVIVVGFSSIGAWYYISQNSKTQLIIYHAGSLTVPLDGSTSFTGLIALFEAQHPDVDVIAQGAGSRTITRWVTETGKTADILMVADYTVIKSLMIDVTPQWTNWYVIFAHNAMVLAYTNTSKYSDEINVTNWYKILQRPDVTFGASDPDEDPCGYRTRLLWKLADLNYSTGGEIYQNLTTSSNYVIRPKSVDLLALLESGDLDYAFEYKSVAVQHSLNYLTFPESIDLSSNDYASVYAQVNITLTDGTVKIGTPIQYAFTVPVNAPHRELAIEFLKFVMGSEGRKVFEDAGQPPIYPGLANNVTLVPEELRSYVAQK